MDRRTQCLKKQTNKNIKTTRQKIIYDTLHRKIQIEQHESHYKEKKNNKMQKKTICATKANDGFFTRSN